MTDTNTADISGEEEFTFNPPRESERDNSTSSPDETNHDGDDASPDADKKNNQDDPDKDKPFHEHPRWLAREQEWTERFNSQEQRHGEDLKKALDGIRSEFGDKREANAEQTKIPSWFGGTQEQWDSYRADRDAELKTAEERAEARAIEKIKGEKSSQDEAVKKATDHMEGEMKVIATDKTLNPEGLKFDEAKLVQFTIDNQLVDLKGNWNYRAAFEIMKARGSIKPTTTTTVTKDRKALADATIEKKPGGEPTQKDFKTSSDFKKPGARPW